MANKNVMNNMTNVEILIVMTRHENVLDSDGGQSLSIVIDLLNTLVTFTLMNDIKTHEYNG